MITIDKSSFMSHGKFLTKGLFLDAPGDYTWNYDAYFTLKDEDYTSKDGKVFRSLYKLYMEIEDETEWVFATTVFVSWSHWQEICKCKWFIPHIEKWRKELELKLRARYLKNMKDVAQEGGREGLQANKYLLDKGYLTEKKPRGRPSKAQVLEEANRLALEQHDVKDDLSRLGLKN